MAEYVCMRTVDQIQIADTKQQTYLGWAHFPVRDLEHSQGVSSQVGVDCQHQKHDKHRRGYSLAYVTGKREPKNEEHRAEGIYDVVHIESVARTLAIPVARQCAVKTVAKPVEKDAEIHEVQHQWHLLAGGVADTGHQHRPEPKDRQVIGVYPFGHAASETAQYGSFKRRKYTCLLSVGILKSVAVH